VAEFIAITSCEPAKAAQYLCLTDGHLEQALQLYFDSPHLDFGPGPGPAAAASAAAAAPAHQPIDVDSDDALSDVPPAGTEDDEAMAQRLQQEIYAEPGTAADNVRAPMQRTTETLVGPDATWGLADADVDADAGVDALVQDQLARRRAGRAGIFNQRTTHASVWDNTPDADARRRELATATGGASEQSSKMSMLAELFRPPFELMCQDSWEEARTMGKAREKWLLVNIQDPAIFDCQRLNRDIWKNDDIKATVRENFIFMQYAKDNPRGQQYVNYYFHARDSSDAYPHIAIVDPRTGEQVKVWSGPPIPDPVDFHAQLHEFLDRYSLNVNAKNPVAKRKAEVKKLDVDRMTEDEMMEWALQNSMDKDAQQGPKHNDPDALTKSFDNAQGKGKGKGRATTQEPEPSTAAQEEHQGTTSAFARISSHAPHTEPSITDPKVTTRIQFRGPSGRPIVRRFYLSDPVRRIYEWIKSDAPWEGKQGSSFDLTFTGNNLLEHLDSPIEQAGLKGVSIMVEFVDTE